MKKIMIVIATISLLSCEKEEVGCNCGSIVEAEQGQEDVFAPYETRVKSNCTGKEIVVYTDIFYHGNMEYCQEEKW